MALAETAKLVASLELQDKFSKTVRTAESGLGRLEKRFGGLGGTAARGFGMAALNLTRIGVVAGGVVTAAVKTGIDLLSDLENATSAVDGAIKQMGLSGQITSSQVVAWANEIEDAIGAAFDERDIARATATLIRFGKTTPSNLKQAMQVIADLATKTGDVDSAATLLGKALADPTKAAGKLAKNGVILTKAEQDQIKAFVKAGEAAKAQQLILDSLTKTTQGAALASQGPYARSIATLSDAWEHARMALAKGFLPVLIKVADKLKTWLSDKGNLQKIEDFGNGLAGAFEAVLSYAEQVPWKSIGDAMSLAGQGAKAALDLFMKLPPDIKALMVSGWGLNKLTGGAFGSIIGQLGSGLVKGVLGMNAGVVNIKAATVVGGAPLGTSGGAVAAAGAKGKVASAAAGIAKVFMVGMAVGVAAELANIFVQQSAEIRQQGEELKGQAKSFTQDPATSRDAIVGAIRAIDEKIDPYSWDNLALDITNGFNGGKDALLATRAELVAKLRRQRSSRRARPLTLSGRATPRPMAPSRSSTPSTRRTSGPSRPASPP
jgi:hypothetical protein